VDTGVGSFFSGRGAMVEFPKGSQKDFYKVLGPNVMKFHFTQSKNLALLNFKFPYVAVALQLSFRQNKNWLDFLFFQCTATDSLVIGPRMQVFFCSSTRCGMKSHALKCDPAINSERLVYVCSLEKSNCVICRSIGESNRPEST